MTKFELFGKDVAQVDGLTWRGAPREKDGGRRWLVLGQNVEGARRGSSATGTAKRESEAVSSP